VFEQACGSPDAGVDWPPAPASAAAEGDYPVVGEVLARYADLDADSRLSEAALARYMEQARSTVIRRVGLGDLGLLVASVDIINHSWRPVGGPVTLPTGISHIGRSSFVVRSIALRRDRLLALSDSTMVVTDRATGRPRAMPEDFRRQLAGLRLPGE
jgi:acyl-CoA thioesterase FadM